MNSFDKFIIDKSKEVKKPIVKNKKFIKKKYLNNYFDHIYLINLKNRPKRLIKILIKLHKLRIHVQIIPAINGRLEPYFSDYLKYLNKPINDESNHPLELERNSKIISSPGAWGYLLSWKNIIQDATLNKYKKILIFDDDIIFIKNFARKFSNWINTIPDNWKVLQLGATQNIKFRSRIKRNYFHPEVTDGSYATAISSSIYKTLLSEINKMNCPLDSGPLRTIYAKYPKKCFVAYPHLIIADVSQSDIRDKRDILKFSKIMDWNLKLYDMKYEKIKIVIYARDSCNLIEEIIDILNRFSDLVDILIINDASTDNTAEVLENCDLSSNYRIITNQTVLGPDASFKNIPQNGYDYTINYSLNDNENILKYISKNLTKF